VAQVHKGIAELLHEALVLDFAHVMELKLRRTALARFYRWKKLNLLAPLKGVAA
jgi:hypothetical protein